MQTLINSNATNKIKVWPDVQCQLFVLTDTFFDTEKFSEGQYFTLTNKISVDTKKALHLSLNPSAFSSLQLRYHTA